MLQAEETHKQTHEVPDKNRRHYFFFYYHSTYCDFFPSQNGHFFPVTLLVMVVTVHQHRYQIEFFLPSQHKKTFMLRIRFLMHNCRLNITIY